MANPLKYLFTLGIPVALAGAAAAWLMMPEFNSERVPQYDVAEVQKGLIRKVVSTSGPVRALVTVSVGSQVSGQVDKLYVDFNSEVKPGDVLATIDPRTFDSKVAAAKADLEAAKATLANQEALLEKAKSVRDLAGRTQERQQALQQKGYAATATLDSARRDAEVAQSDIAVAKAQIESAKATIAQRSAALKQAEIDLERTRIVSPIVGTVISRTIDPGQTVAASLQAPELFKIAEDLRRIRIEAQVNEADVGAVTNGNPAQFSVDAYPDRTFEGKVTQVRLAATELANVVTYTVIIEAMNEDRKLFPGMTANVQIEVAKQDGVLRIPNDALRFRPRNVDEAAGQAERNGQGGGAQRGERQIAKLKNDLSLTDAQERSLREAIGKLMAERQQQPPGGGGFDRGGGDDPTAMRQRMMSTIEQTLRPILTDEQRPLLDKWKRGRENTKSGTVYVRDAKGLPERRFVRLGLSDDQFTEIAGGQLNVGDQVIVRTGSAKK